MRLLTTSKLIHLNLNKADNTDIGKNTAKGPEGGYILFPICTLNFSEADGSKQDVCSTGNNNNNNVLIDFHFNSCR
jgi:hypothetical protein